VLVRVEKVVAKELVTVGREGGKKRKKFLWLFMNFYEKMIENDEFLKIDQVFDLYR
jgi:hypothetical protein